MRIVTIWARTVFAQFVSELVSSTDLWLSFQSWGNQEEEGQQLGFESHKEGSLLGGWVVASQYTQHEP
eukprot:3539031-Amphidinium_carterae.1